MIALIILGVVFIALQGSSIIVVRSLAESERETIAGRLAETQRERAFATACASTSGSDSSNAVAVTWVASPAGGLVHVSQTSRYPGRFGDRVQSFNAVGACQ
jgi:hypothetical protein